jgi:hypothetical protein
MSGQSTLCLQTQWQGGISGVVDELVNMADVMDHFEAVLSMKGTLTLPSDGPTTSTRRRCCWVLLDADDCQLAPSSSDQQHASSLFQLLAERHGRRCAVLVQNVHFLPFGPSGTAHRTKGLLRVRAGQ